MPESALWTSQGHPSLLTTTQAAEYLSVSTGTLANWRYRREGPPFVKAGKSVRYRLKDLEF
ncbi:helix-turn-helix domain-containing protein [Streptomyces gardneri]|uniref:helix-turn-helix domain-containing protein n=1 Tax=Streptomyces gardneri TaxID=66892 RepID=UPI0037D81670